jgi:5'-nucleotidase
MMMASMHLVCWRWQSHAEIAKKVTVLAPQPNWSASGHVKTLHRPLRVTETPTGGWQLCLGDRRRAFRLRGAGQLGFIPEKIDMVVSGINPYANIGHDVTYSGTVTAAMEAAIWGIPGVAVSLDKPRHLSGVMDYQGGS